ncbi:indole-3-glycerol phosphate synthase [Aliidongia dinghuensis]|uniref:Indole-3-glycerol phosphate synthase n=1 Tax=Aliidongia dinghuensis TaxID=1867774 RepID=A0A8J2YZF3_9PROT|nr:indole-3-glycerol phosphate synthase TrpC [Aliidongia dinghuensis]GGF40294.1 indole-3-glycerol phosphate synthase [Aliidongia dinghuensis]
MSDILAEIVARKRDDLKAVKTAQPFATVDRAARQSPAPRGFAAAIERKLAAGRYALITEIKRASPSGGLIRPDFDPAALARAYEAAGAACLSVLTDEPYFQGTIAHLQAARAAVALPVLRKDFMVDPYQVAEARAIGADCILIIMAALADGHAAELAATAHDYGLDVLIEVHDRVELDRALKLDARLLGINNRNLKTLKTDLATTEALAAAVPQDRVLVSESGLKTAADLARMSAVGARTFLVGESLLRQEDVAQATLRLQGLAA